MKRYCCPLSLDASRQIKELTESYRLAIAAASDYNGISLADRRQVEAAIARADRLGNAIDCYLNGWQCGIPCLLYDCNLEHCRRNSELLECINKLPKLCAEAAEQSAALSVNNADAAHTADSPNPQAEQAQASERNNIQVERDPSAGSSNKDVNK